MADSKRPTPIEMAELVDACSSERSMHDIALRMASTIDTLTTELAELKETLTLERTATQSSLFGLGCESLSADNAKLRLALEKLKVKVKRCDLLAIINAALKEYDG